MNNCMNACAHHQNKHRHSPRALLLTSTTLAVPRPLRFMLLGLLLLLGVALLPALLLLLLLPALLLRLPAVLRLLLWLPAAWPAAALASCVSPEQRSLHQCCSRTVGEPPCGTVARSAAVVRAASLLRGPEPSGSAAAAAEAAAAAGRWPKCSVDHMPKSCRAAVCRVRQQRREQSSWCDTLSVVNPTLLTLQPADTACISLAGRAPHCCQTGPRIPCQHSICPLVPHQAINICTTDIPKHVAHKRVL
jgi:hypothetical protein